MKRIDMLLWIAGLLLVHARSLVSGTLYVSPAGNDVTGNGTAGNPFLTIQRGINVAIDGDTVRVLAGTYVAAVNVNKSLALIGSGPDTATTIEAPTDFGTNPAYNYARANFITERAIVHIGATSVITATMRGFTIDGRRRGPDTTQVVGYSGILAERCLITLTNNIVKDILPADSGHTHHSDGFYNGRGIHVRGDSSVATISNNRLQDINRFYILVNATDIITQLPAVFPIATVSGDTVLGKGFYNGGQKGIWFNNGAWGTISGNVISNMDYTDPFIEPDRATGITTRRQRLNPTKRNFILNNTIIASSFTNNKGIFVESRKDSVADNTITGFRFGLQIDDPDTVIAVRNTITGGQVGVVISTTTVGGPYGVPSLVGPYAVTVGGSPANKNTITGQTSAAAGGSAIALSFRDPIADGTFMSNVPVNATYNDFGVYTENEIRTRIWDRADTAAIAGNLVDTVYYSQFYAPNVRASVKVMLEGPYNTTLNLMDKTLNTSGYLATRYPGVAVHPDAVDSINIEIRNRDSAATSTTRKFRPAWLLTDGTIRSFTDTTKNYVEFDTFAGNYYIAVRHMNHVAIMSATAQLLEPSTSSPYDFTASLSSAYGTNPMKEMGSRFVMFSGDVNESGLINAADRLIVKNNTGGGGYNVADVNLNGLVNAADRLVVRNNTGVSSQIP